MITRATYLELEFVPLKIKWRDSDVLVSMYLPLLRQATVYILTLMILKLKILKLHLEDNRNRQWGI
jgi:hypothetical protein